MNELAWPMCVTTGHVVLMTGQLLDLLVPLSEESFAALHFFAVEKKTDLS